ncbi:MAG: T9SS type A sorting domain-containing protein [Bacteroidota bacterium]
MNSERPLPLLRYLINRHSTVRLHTSHYWWVLVFIIFHTSLIAQTTQGFEGNTVPDYSIPNCWFIDPDNVTTHQLVNSVLPCGTLIVTEPSGTFIGYTTTWMPVPPGSGFSDGDNFGVNNPNTMEEQFGAGILPIEGVNSFVFEDTDGTVVMEFDAVDLTGTASPQFSMDYLVNSTGYETADFFKIRLEVFNCASATTITLLDVNGDDIDNGVINEEVWTELTSDLSAYTNCSVRLIVEGAIDSSTEQYAIDDISFSEGSILPITLGQFGVKQEEDYVQLSWTTETETNNEGFEVHYSRDGHEWILLDFIQGKGESTVRVDYEFVHTNPTPGYNYYRLKQIDFDENYEMFPVRSILWVKENNSTPIDLILSLNQSSEMVTLIFDENFIDENDFSIAIFSSIGELVKVIKEDGKSNRSNVDIRDLSEGLYFITVNNGYESQTVKFIR